MALQDLFFKATDRATWDAFAWEIGLVFTDAEGNIISGPEVTLDFIDNLVHKTAILDQNGNVITPVVIDNDLHINLRLTGIAEAIAEDLRDLFIKSNDRRSVKSKRRNNKTHFWLHKIKGVGTISLIDPAPETRFRIWLGDLAPLVSRG